MIFQTVVAMNKIAMNKMVRAAAQMQRIVRGNRLRSQLLLDSRVTRDTDLWSRLWELRGNRIVDMRRVYNRPGPTTFAEWEADFWNFK